MASVYYSYNTTDLYLSNSDLSADETYGTDKGYTCGTYSPTYYARYNESTCETITILNSIDPDSYDYFFANFENITKIENITNLEFNSATSMSEMFDGCKNLISIDLSHFDTSNITDTNGMFSDCSSLSKLDVSTFNTSLNTNISFMFSGCSSLSKLDVSNFDTKNVYLMYGVFEDCSSLKTLDLSNWDTSGVKSEHPYSYAMNNMFKGCSSLSKLDISNFNTSNVKSAPYMFYGCESLTELDLSNWDTRKLSSVSNMFSNCTNLKTIYSYDFAGSLDSQADMFDGCDNLSGAIHMNPTKVSAAYANSETGYFTNPIVLNRIRTLKNKNEFVFYPQTIVEAISNKKGEKLESIIPTSCEMDFLMEILEVE